MSTQGNPASQSEQKHHSHHGSHHHHHHHHGHDHGHDHHEHQQHKHDERSHNDRNIAHWNSVAKSYNSTNTQERFGNLIAKAHTFVLANISSIGVDFIDPSTSTTDATSNDATDTAQSPSSPPKTVRILDYACGPGTITNILAGRATEYIGMDLSPGMVAEYNERFSTSTEGNPKLNAQAYTGNLFDPAGPTPQPLLSEPRFSNFNLVAVGFGFHHFEDLPLVTSRLVERLAPGGVLMILDFFTHDKEDIIDDKAVMTIAHHGFSERQIRLLFESSGLTEVEVLDFGEDVKMMGHAKRRPFLARGKKPKETASAE